MKDEGAWKTAVVQDQRELGLIGAGMSGIGTSSMRSTKNVIKR